MSKTVVDVSLFRKKLYGDLLITISWDLFIFVF